MNTQTHFPRGRASVQAGVVETLPVASRRTSNVERRTSNIERDRGLQALSREEADELKRRETAIGVLQHRVQDDLKAWAKHMEFIRDNRLYKAEFHTFDDYCDARCALTSRRIRQLLDFVLTDRVIEEAKQAKLNRGSLSASTTDTGLTASPGTSIPTPARASAAQAEEHPGEFWRDFEERSPKSKVQGPKPAPARTERQLRSLRGRPKEEVVEAYEEAEKMAGPGKVPTAKQVEWAVKSLKFKVQSPPLMADREPGWVCGTPGPEWLALGAAARKQVLEASQRARVAIRDLQDLLPANARYFFRCSDAVAQIDAIEADLKGPEVSTQRREDRGETQQKGRPKGTDGRA